MKIFITLFIYISDFRPEISIINSQLRAIEASDVYNSITVQGCQLVGNGNPNSSELLNIEKTEIKKAEKEIKKVQKKATELESKTTKTKQETKEEKETNIK